MIDEHQILEDLKPDRGKLVDIFLRHSRTQANDDAGFWRTRGMSARIFHRYIRADGVSYPVFMVVVREKAHKRAQSAKEKEK